VSILSALKSILFGSRGSSAPQKKFNPEHFIYIKIPDPIGPLARGEKYEDTLEPLLAEKGCGYVSGGGSGLGDAMPDGKRPIEFCGIDVETTDPDNARAILRTALPSLGAPEGTELHFTRSEQKLQDQFTNEGWLLEQPRTFLHPGFSV
jgi:hypothetical protein